MKLLNWFRLPKVPLLFPAGPLAVAESRAIRARLSNLSRFVSCTDSAHGIVAEQGERSINETYQHSISSFC